jgi:hypothetical protein
MLQMLVRRLPVVYVLIQAVDLMGCLRDSLLVSSFTELRFCFTSCILVKVSFQSGLDKVGQQREPS